MVFKKKNKVLKPKIKPVKDYPRNIEDREDPKGKTPVHLTMKRRDLWEIRSQKGEKNET